MLSRDEALPNRVLAARRSCDDIFRGWAQSPGAVLRFPGPILDIFRAPRAPGTLWLWLAPSLGSLGRVLGPGSRAVLSDRRRSFDLGSPVQPTGFRRSSAAGASRPLAPVGVPSHNDGFAAAAGPGKGYRSPVPILPNDSV